MKYPIYIPSRGRAKTATTPRILRENGVRFNLVVEPRDFEEYRAEFPEETIRLLVLPANDRNLAFARTFIKRSSQENGEPYHWQLDDNIKGFYLRPEGKNLRSTPFEVLDPIEVMVDKYKNVALAGPLYTTWAWTKRRKVEVNKLNASAFLVNNGGRNPIEGDPELFNLEWRPDTIEDVDYSVRVLRLNYVTLLFNRLLIHKPGTSTMKGGCTEIYYANGGMEARYKRLAEDWAEYGITAVVKSWGKWGMGSSSRLWKSFRTLPTPVHPEVDPLTGQLYLFEGEKK